MVRWVRRTLIAALSAHAVLFCWSIYRRIWQVLHIELQTQSSMIRSGTQVGYDVVTSGEVPNLIRFELTQGAHTETLLERRGRTNGVSAYDPRVFRDAPLIPMTSGTLDRFQPGPATLRVLGFGGVKLLRTPPTKVKELQVTLQQ